MKIGEEPEPQWTLYSIPVDELDPTPKKLLPSRSTITCALGALCAIAVDISITHDAIKENSFIRYS